MDIDDGTVAVQRLARQAGALAEVVRDAAAELSGRSNDLQWRSPAAGCARSLADEQVSRWRSCAAELDDVAAQLLAHGRAAAERAAVLQAAAAAAREVTSGQSGSGAIGAAWHPAATGAGRP